MSVFHLHHAKVLDALAEMPSDHFDGCLTDPPYGLNFMGKEWDHGVPGVETWREVLRVLKPGANLLAFGGTRTYHRLAVAIEDAGFELHDSILVPGLAWVHGQGMPKGLDIARQVDALDAVGPRRDRALIFTRWMRSTGIKASQIAEATGSAMASHYLTDKEQPEIATASMFDLLRPLLPNVPEEIERLVESRTVESENLKRRPVNGSRIAKDARAGDLYAPGAGTYLKREIEITTAFSEDAKRWEGYRTDLKPAWEPVIWAIKPARGSYADNAIRFGVAGLNIVAGRVERADPAVALAASQGEIFGEVEARAVDMGEAGRHPANLALLHSPLCILTEDEVFHVQRRGTVMGERGIRVEQLEARCPPGCPVADLDRQSGGLASQMFYVAKVAATERAGSKHPTLKPVDLCRYLAALILPPARPGDVRRLLTPFSGAGSEMLGAGRAGWEDVTGIEMELPSIEDAERRIRGDAPLFNVVTRS